MKGLIPIDPAGRLVLPKQVRRKLNLEHGGVCRVDVVGGHAELTPVSQARRQLKKVGRFLVAEATGTAFDAVEAVNAIRQERL